MINVLLTNNKGYKWYRNENFQVKGYLYSPENNYYEKENLVEYFNQLSDIDDFIIKLKNINGVFSLVAKFGEKTIIAVDRTRMFPLFYSIDKQTYIFDDIKEILEIIEPKLDETNVLEYSQTGFVTENRTLLKNVFQVQPGEYIVFQNDEIIKKSFFSSFYSKTFNTDSYGVLKKQLTNIIVGVFERLATSLRGKKIILPLSGGYDSRLIALMLKKNGFDNVLCFTYGNPENSEILLSKKVAEILNFDWLFIDYNNELYDNYLSSQTFVDYAHYAGKFSSMPYLQEYFAVKYLKENNYLTPDSVFIPGHSGDFIAGSHLRYYSNTTDEMKISDEIYKKHYKFNQHRRRNKKYFFNKIRKNISSADSLNHSLSDNWNCIERQAKYINNSSSVFNFFGYEHRFPFWDNEIVQFFRTMKFEHKYLKKLYDETLRDNFFVPNNLSFSVEAQPTAKEINIQIIKNKIKMLIPYFIKKKFIGKNNPFMMKEITQEMIFCMKNNDMFFNQKIEKYTEIIIQWYYYFSKNSVDKLK